MSHFTIFSSEKIQLLSTVQRNSNAVHRWTTCRLLIIDEVSMIDANLFTTLERIARAVRDRPTPFGGIQLVLTGDFLQLPPVCTRRDAAFCFEVTLLLDFRVCLNQCFSLCV